MYIHKENNNTSTHSTHKRIWNCSDCSSEQSELSLDCLQISFCWGVRVGTVTPKSTLNDKWIWLTFTWYAPINVRVINKHRHGKPRRTFKTHIKQTQVAVDFAQLYWSNPNFPNTLVWGYNSNSNKLELRIASSPRSTRVSGPIRVSDTRIRISPVLVLNSDLGPIPDQSINSGSNSV